MGVSIMPTIEEIINLGFNNHQAGKLEQAEFAYTEALKLDCENAELFNLMGVLKLQQNDVESAIDWVEKAVNARPCEYFYETLFQAYIRRGFYERIVECKESVIKKYPKNFSLFFNIALAYKNLKMYKEAIKFYDKALKIDPTSYQGWFNLAHLYNIENQGKNAVSAFKICKKLKPKDSETSYFLAIALMRTKNYEKGLKLFENRISRDSAVGIMKKTYPNLATDETLWRGQNIKNKTAFVYYEGGFGDVIMFSRYLPLLKKKCKKLVFYPQKQLVPLFNDSGLGVDELIEGFIPESGMDFDVHMPIMSLPYLLGLKGNKVFHSAEGYLKVDSNLVENFKNKYFANEEFKIGIKWRGNTFYDEDRVIPSEAFLPLFELDNTKFYSFQTFEGAEDINKLNQKHDIIDIGKDLLDFEQTAAALKNLDLVICNDTSLAHLAGALGIPCLVLLPYEVNWRWHDDLRKCDWYESVKLFRQKSAGQWDTVFEEVKTYLEKILG